MVISKQFMTYNEAEFRSKLEKIIDTKITIHGSQQTILYLLVSPPESVLETISGGTEIELNKKYLNGK